SSPTFTRSGCLANLFFRPSRPPRALSSKASATATSWTGPSVLRACPAAPVPRPPQPIRPTLTVSPVAAWAERAMNWLASVAPAMTADVLSTSRRVCWLDCLSDMPISLRGRNGPRDARGPYVRASLLPLLGNITDFSVALQNLGRVVVVHVPVFVLLGLAGLLGRRDDAESDVEGVAEPVRALGDLRVLDVELFARPGAGGTAAELGI